MRSAHAPGPKRRNVAVDLARQVAWGRFHRISPIANTLPRDHVHATRQYWKWFGLPSHLLSTFSGLGAACGISEFTIIGGLSQIETVSALVPNERSLQGPEIVSYREVDLVRQPT